MDESILDQIIHTMREIERNRFTLICPPEVEQRVRALLVETGLDGMGCAVRTATSPGSSRRE